MQFGRSFVLLVVVFLYVFQIYARSYEETGKIPIQNFTTKDYLAAAINNCVVEDENGLIYVGNNLGVLQFDGNQWTTIKINSDKRVFALNVDSLGVVYVGAEEELGYLWPDSKGVLKYISILKYVPKYYNSIGRVNKILYYMGNVYFQTTKEMVLIWNGESINVIKLEGLENMFLARDKLFFYKKGGKFKYFKNKSLHFVDIEGDLSKFVIKAFLPLSFKETLVVTEKNGLFVLSEVDKYQYELNEFNTELDLFFNANTIKNALFLESGNISIGTYDQGIVVMNNKGRLVQFVNEKSSLQDLTIEGQFQDSHGSLWVALRNGISKIDINSPLVYFQKDLGLNGTIEKVIRSNGFLYVAGGQGLYCLEKPIKIKEYEKVYNYSKFKKIFNGQCWDVLNYKTNQGEFLMIASTQGTFIVDKFQKVSKISSYDPNVLYQSPKDPNRVFVGLFPGFASIYFEKGKWKDEPKMEQITEKVFRMVMDKDGSYWLGTNQPAQGVINLIINRYNSQLSSIQIQRYDTTAGLPNQFIYPEMGSNGVVFTTTKGIYGFDEETSEFSTNPFYGVPFSDGSYCIHNFRMDNMGNAWVCSIDSNEKVDIGYLWNDQQGQYQWENRPFRNISESVIMAIYHEENGITWLGGPDGLFRYDAFLDVDYSNKFSCLIRNVSVGRGTLLFGGAYLNESNNIVYTQPNNMMPELQYQDNTVSFQFSAHSKEGKSVDRFSFKLEGFDDHWTEYKSDVSAKYTNLHEGEYTFRVIAKNLYDEESTEAVYNFTILPPWYRTVVAYIAYIILIIAFIYAIVQFSVYRLKAAEKRLKAIVADRTAEVVKQREEISEKNKDILASITYAQNIQKAMLPTSDDLERMIPDSFLLFKPRDIVSGDFYWALEKDEKVFYCTADCTGHGVPGAFMSMICTSFLTEAVKSNDLSNPSDIFSFVRNQIIEYLKQESNTQKDGMDATLCVLSRKKGQPYLNVACANNSLYILRKNKLDLLEVTSEINGEIVSNMLNPVLEKEQLGLFQIKEDRQPVGLLSGDLVPFTNHEFKLMSGDIIYTFTDGFQDQFGGSKGKKFMIKRLKQLLMEIGEMPIKDQRNVLDENLIDWIGTENNKGEIFKQVDDVLVIGVEIV